MSIFDTRNSTTRILNTQRSVGLKKLPVNEGRDTESGLCAMGHNKVLIPDKPIFSVITVVKNGESCLEKTICSVLEHQYSNVEYIVIDGGSSDNTLGIIKKYEDKIDYWISEPDKGIYDAMNKGVLLSSNDTFILFLNCGDLLFKLPVDTNLSHDNIYLGIVELATGSIFANKVNYKLKLFNAIHHQSVLVSSKLMHKHLFDCSYKTYADFDLMQQFNINNYKFVTLNSLRVSTAPAGISNKFKFIEMTKIVFKNYGLLWYFLSIIYGLLFSVKKNTSYLITKIHHITRY